MFAPVGAQAVQEDLRRRAVKLAEQGKTQVEVAGLLGVRRQAVGRWVKAYRQSGDAMLAAPPAWRLRR